MGESSLKIIHYPHPTLRHRSKPVRRVDAKLKSMISEMFDLMYEASGIGLAANQVDLPLRFFVCNLAGERGEGEELVFINPVISRPKGNEEREEGCLSLPGVCAPVKRPASVHFEAYGLDGTAFQAELDGMMARVVQHEVDHLDGVMFIDRLPPTVEMNVGPELEEFSLEFQSRRSTGEIPDDEALAQRLADIENEYAVVD